MKTLVKKLRQFLRQCGGPTAVEYAILLFLVLLGAMTAVSLLGNSVGNSIGSTAEALPLGTSDEGSGESAQDGDDEDEESGRGRDGRGRGGRGRGRGRASNGALQRNYQWVC